MKSISTLIGAVMLAAGVLAMIYGGINYTEESTALKVGPLQVDVQQQKRLNVPMWAGLALAVAGGGLMAMGVIKR